jgi:hypothetical protein
MKLWKEIAAVAVTVVLWQGAARAQVQLPVQDAIFSSPLVAYTDQEAMPFVYTSGTGWTANNADEVIWQNPPPGASDYIDNLTPDYSVNLSQCLAVDPNPGQWSLQYSPTFPYEGAASIGITDGITLPPTLTLSQTLGSKFLANASYQLTVAVGIPYVGDVPSLPDATADLQLALIYTDGSSVQHIVSSVDILNTPATGLSGTHMLDFSTPLQFIAPASGAVGQDIGILLTTSDPNSGGSFFNVSDVQVTEVPEPASMSLLVAGSVLLLYRRRRSPAA